MKPLTVSDVHCEYAMWANCRYSLSIIFSKCVQPIHIWASLQHWSCNVMHIYSCVWKLQTSFVLHYSRADFMSTHTMAFSYRVTPLNCFLSAKEEVAELVFAFRWALVSGWVKFFNWVRSRRKQKDMMKLLCRPLDDYFHLREFIPLPPPLMDIISIHFFLLLWNPT